MIRFTLVTTLLLVAACGGGGGGAPEPGGTSNPPANNSPVNTPPANVPPVANAGNNQQVTENDLVTLSASGSTDSDGEIASFLWTQSTGTSVVLQNATGETATFVAPDVSNNQALSFILTVRDEDGLANSDSISITVEPILNAPVAQTTAEQNVQSGDTVLLDGEASDDSDGEIIAYQWQQISGQPVALANATSTIASFIAPNVNSDLAFRLTVTDNDQLTNSVDTVVHVQHTEPEPADTFSIQGEISVPTNTVVDGDVNNPLQPTIPNNDISTAQEIPNPANLGGYVNQASEGTEGTNFEEGDINDFYSATLLENQNITLLVATPDEGDVDLYLLDESGNILDASLETGSVESLVTPEAGNYIIVAHSFSGASNYTLILGQDTQTSTSFAHQKSSLKLSNSFSPGEIVAQHKASSTVSQKGNTLTKTAINNNPVLPDGISLKAGAVDREMLLNLNSIQTQSVRAAQKTRNLSVGWRNFLSVEMLEKWRTLEAIKNLRSQADIEYAEPNFILQANAVPNDEYFDLQWHYSLINLPAAWDMTTGSETVTVAVIDTGVLLDHPDLTGQFVPGFDFISSTSNSNDGDGIDNNPYDPGDSDGSRPSSFHGTHVSGTVAASSNNSVGVAGVAWGVKVMPLRALGVNGGSGYDIAQAVRYAAGLPNDSGTAANPPVDIINLSLGGSGFSQASQNVYSAARDAGVIIVAAAGNDSSSTLNFPAAYEGVISVSAVDASSDLAPYSNFGNTIDIAAPGGNASRDVNGDGFPDGVLSTTGEATDSGMQFGFSFQNGTSMASPHVAGVLALMRSINPDLSPAQVDALLQGGELTDDIGSAGRDNAFGHGLLNAQKAVSAALESIGSSPEDIPVLEVNPPSLNLGLSASTEITARNGGSGDLEILQVNFSESWLLLEELETDDSGLGRWLLTIDRNGLADGFYSATISIVSTANTVNIPVFIQVGNQNSNFGAAHIYVLLVDAETREVVAIDNGLTADGLLSYAFNDIPLGIYEIYAGSDNNFDNFICDGGESCGAYLTFDQPVQVIVQSNESDLDFPVFYNSTLPTAQSSNTSSLSPKSVSGF